MLLCTQQWGQPDTAATQTVLLQCWEHPKYLSSEVRCYVGSTLGLFFNIYHDSSHPPVAVCFRARFRQGDCWQRTMQHFLSAICYSGTAPELPWAHLPGPAQTNLRQRGQGQAQLCLPVQPAGSSWLVHPHRQARGAEWKEN